MGLTLVTAAASYPVTLAEAKAQCRVTSSDEDTKLNDFIAAATDYVEQYLGRSIISQTWRLTLDKFSDTILLPRGPVQSVSSIKYDDANGAEQTLAGAVYTLDSASDPQWVVRNSDSSWPTINDAVNSVRIEYVAGYAAVPASIKHAILLIIGQWYDNREAVAPSSMATPEHAVRALLSNYRAFAQ